MGESLKFSLQKFPTQSGVSKSAKKTMNNENIVACETLYG